MADGPVLVVAESKTPTPDEAQSETIRQFLAAGHKRFRTSAEAEAALRKEQLEDKRILSGEHWPEDIKARRLLDGRPCLTINRLPQFVRQVTNQQRQTRPAIQVNPVDSGADVDTAEVLQGVIRHIETISDADVAYASASYDQASIGRGYWRILTDYVDEHGFDQELRIERIRNPFTVYMDPSCQKADYSDARYAFIIEDVPKDEYQQRYPNSQLASLTEFTSIGDQGVDWMPEGKIRIAEYFYVEEVKTPLSLVQLPDGSTEIVPIVPNVDGVKVLAKRDVMQRKVKWCVINAVEILEGNDDKTAGRDWPGKWIPIVPVLGDEIDINGQVDLRGMVRDGRDPQRMYDYWVSAETEMIALAPRAPYVGYEGQFEGHEKDWKQANVRNFAFLQVKPMTIGGQPAPFPQRQQFSPDIQAIVVATQQSDNDLKAVTGLYDPSLGQQGPQESGKAILARQRQGEIANSNYLDNLARAIRFTGRILVDLIPKIYDAPRILRILGADDQPRTIMVHAGQPPDPQRPKDKQAIDMVKGLDNVYDLGTGRYDVTITVGPSYQSRRQEGAEAMIEVARANPQIVPVIGDLMFGAFDWPGARQIAERLKKVLPPQVQEPEDGQPQIPPQVQQQMHAAQQQIQQLGQQLQQAQMMLQTEAQKLAAEGQTKQMQLTSQERIAQMEMASRERIAAMSAQAQLAATGAKLNHDQTMAEINAQLEELANRLEFGREMHMALTQNALSAQSAAADAAAQQDGQPVNQAGA
jgi:hypothetical protein